MAQAGKEQATSSSHGVRKKKGWPKPSVEARDGNRNRERRFRAAALAASLLGSQNGDGCSDRDAKYTFCASRVCRRQYFWHYVGSAFCSVITSSPPTQYVSRTLQEPVKSS